MEQQFTSCYWVGNWSRSASSANPASLNKTPKAADLCILNKMLVYMYGTKARGLLRGEWSNHVLCSQRKTCIEIPSLTSHAHNCIYLAVLVFIILDSIPSYCALKLSQDTKPYQSFDPYFSLLRYRRTKWKHAGSSAVLVPFILRILSHPSHINQFIFHTFSVIDIFLVCRQWCTHQKPESQVRFLTGLTLTTDIQSQHLQ